MPAYDRTPAEERDVLVQQQEMQDRGIGWGSSQFDDPEQYEEENERIRLMLLEEQKRPFQRKAS